MSEQKSEFSLMKLGLSQALRAIAAGDCTPEELINAYYDQIEARETEVMAWQFTLSREEYLQKYQQKKAFYQASVLQGLPIAVKDIIDTRCMPTEMGSPLHCGRQPVDNASCVNLLMQAGGIILGKTVTTEFAYFKPGKTRNPKDLKRTPGGSSSGSAASVADFMVPVALGSQTAASVIRPAAYCGVVGYVGSRGEFSLRGIQPLAQSLDSLGIFARQVEDIELLRSMLLLQPHISSVKSNRPYRILVCQGSAIGNSEPEMDGALQQFSEFLSQKGVEIIEMDSGDLIRNLVDHHENIMTWEVVRNLSYEAEHEEQVSEALQQLFKKGREMRYESYQESLEAVTKIGHWLWTNPKHLGIDAILAPAAPGVAPMGHDSTGQPHMSRAWQVLGLPVVTLPGFTDKQGLPLGLQLIGQAEKDDELLAIARWAAECLSNK